MILLVFLMLNKLKVLAIQLSCFQLHDVYHVTNITKFIVIHFLVFINHLSVFVNTNTRK